MANEKPTLMLYRLSRRSLANLARLCGAHFSSGGKLLPRNEIAKRVHGAMWNGASYFGRREVDKETGEIELVAKQGKLIRVVNRETGEEHRVQRFPIGAGIRWFVEIILAPKPVEGTVEA
jgi:hypothetical protein